MRKFYFGCANHDKGHYLHNEHMRSVHREIDVVPWGYGVEKLMPRHEVQGHALLHHKDGWTALSFPDRSVDHRGGSHSTYIFEAILDYDSALALAKETWPSVFARYNFEIKQVTGEKKR